jgi:hypothetical protein
MKKLIPKTTTLNEVTLDSVWTKWYTTIYEASYDTSNYSQFYKSYKFVSRRCNAGKEFEEWLWGKGATVRQCDGHMELEFSNEQDALMFTLEFV